MSSVTNSSVIEFNSDLVQHLRSLYGLETQERFDEAINILIEWIKKQDHLIQKDTRRDYLGKLIIFCKGSVEKAKVKYDRICTYRTLLPEYFEPFDKKNLGNMNSCFLPTPVKDDYRVFILKTYSGRFSRGFFNYYKFMLMISEYLQTYDYCNNILAVVDHFEADLQDIIKNTNVVELRNVLSIITEGYGLRVKGIHILTTSKAVDFFLQIFKQAVNSKIAQRIHVHAKIDTLYEYVPKDSLPLDYGGKEKSIETLSNNLINALTSKEFLEHYNVMKQFRTNEACRSQDKYSDHMGLAGSFRKLDID
ncbi:uncharacterized protein LOC123665065 [Melitaea cinxia]|uniref:uncharacterized protein LOC123665065 n=1 Tax=Melitaea cinxia TaxID=113334 RepID=UPI001E274308|nr:uncharacterized protein LOC123665065 [Melitaea cinxia]